ncbi:MAG: HigA family addiction module antitoxin [Acinetobacter sp.]
MHNPAHPGEIVTEWLEGLKEEGQQITITELAERIQVTRSLLSRILHGKAPLTPDIALRLNSALGISADLLMRIQVKYALWVESQKNRPVIQPFHSSARAV